MSKNKQTPKKEEKKTPKTPAPAPKAAEKKAEKPVAKTPEKVEEAQVVTAAMNPEKILSHSRRGGLSPDATIQALDLAHRVFVEERDPDLQFPKETAIKVNKIVAVGILCTLADHATNADDSFATVLHTSAYPSLASAAEDLGFKLPDIKALPAGKTADTVMIPASKVEIPAETKEQLKKEKQIRESVKPELDPTKISSEEDVKKALEYMFACKQKNMPTLLTESVDFMKKFREHEAELAENTEAAKAKFANYNVGDWLDDIFGYFRPTVFFNGIGRGMASVTDIEKSPIHAFTIFRDAIKDKATGKPVMSDQDIAYAVKSIVKWVCDVNIESNKKAIENLDPKKNQKEIETCNAQISKYNNILASITGPSSEEIDNLLDHIGSEFDAGGDHLTQECQKANQTFNRICKTYYGKELSTADYKNLDVNIKQYGYHIINLFRAPGEQLMDVGLVNISDLEERSAEEREAAIKEAKKAWAERKTKQKEEETKNA